MSEALEIEPYRQAKNEAEKSRYLETILGIFVEKDKENYLCELSPINIMSGVKFEDERIIYFSPRPYPARNAEEKREEPHQKVAAVDL